ncbi:hypothetical protein [Deinococcus maricopensis]|uniref:Uncharacterized protein n=1 Tax=Deinococcus maricopensis (strain DSM 21211 / LMG 22137 / NRRL B-23946 / LB-34) TaxID=709986 RepID=E8UAU9_DEIML|nr:hypothetical protein [Deinococcus maricopensis]ADV68188.1 hypothetical protein Deima_2554 [Deinococcus maricopensis DSM 21211]
MTDAPPSLQPMFPNAEPILARFLPRGTTAYAGLHGTFADLHAFLHHLHDRGWHGYLHATQDGTDAFVLVYEGRTVTAATQTSSGEAALGELLSFYEQGATLNAYALSEPFARILSGVGSRPGKFKLTPDFTGLHAGPNGATFYAGGLAIASMPTTLQYEGAFPAPQRPITLILPRSLAGWAHHHYALTLRGRDALNPITTVNQAFRAQYGAPGLTLLRALGEHLTPAEYAVRADATLHDLEEQVQALTKGGYVREA